MNVYAKFRCVPLRIKKVLGIFAVEVEKTRKSCTGQVLPSAKYRPTRLVVDAALRRIGKSRHGGHKIANISLNYERI